MKGSVFDRYAEWYDAFNEGKNYADEVQYVLRMVRPHVRAPRRWLDIGCGTGRHLKQLHQQNIEVEGLDRSPSMIEQARVAFPYLTFHVATAQEFDLPRGRDVVSMLFHVLNYQVQDDMVVAALERVASHLDQRGLFVLDFWNTEAVRRDPPQPRARTAAIGGRVLHRLSSPVDDVARRTVTVHYEFRWDHPRGELVHEETHVLRHFTPAELTSLLGACGLAPITYFRWLTDAPLTDVDWYGFVCVRRAEGQ
jgi:ubiquinone/menaquinone biosynthesis C-methylase UbiE